VHWLAKIKEHDLKITASNTIKGHDLALHLYQHPKPSDSSEENENTLSTLFFIENQNHLNLDRESLWKQTLG
jgi:hypothetical protein